MKKSILILCAAALVAGCSPSTKLENSWRDPAVTINSTTFNKIMIAALLKNESTRRSVEEQLTERLKGKGYPSYMMLMVKDMTPENEEKLKQKFTEKGIDGAIVMRLVDVNKKVEYVPGSTSVSAAYAMPYGAAPYGVNPYTYNGGFYGYYGMSYASYSSPGYYQESKTYYVETSVFSLKDNKLIWAGTTSSSNPDNLDKMIHDIAGVISYQMRAEGFISTKK
ncbi:lipoprotein [Taibaiella soli]|uniref:DUF4136 domain-containing protein n=1 Tax=Taibaiella soli TaxID=1649169 RepID=A0A2W2AGL4_9BACT|nr:lipoprotein [Taibaiella soli]PZF74401.1 hypothetical protein DN068_02135 [Taibaiella soli]